MTLKDISGLLAAALLTFLCCTNRHEAANDAPGLSSQQGPCQFPTPPEDTDAPWFSPSDGGVTWKVINRGSGETPRPLDRVTLEFRIWGTEGWCKDIRPFDLLLTSERTGPLEIQTGNAPLQAWRDVLPHMRVGETRRVWAEREVAFGDDSPLCGDVVAYYPVGEVVFDLCLTSIVPVPSPTPPDDATSWSDPWQWEKILRTTLFIWLTRGHGTKLVDLNFSGEVTYRMRRWRFTTSGPGPLFAYYSFMRSRRTPYPEVLTISTQKAFGPHGGIPSVPWESLWESLRVGDHVRVWQRFGPYNAYTVFDVEILNATSSTSR
ncbi:FKBP-type peptidyl-prolyl cis-trans isomerase [Myxococcota bacterium]